MAKGLVTDVLWIAVIMVISGMVIMISYTIIDSMITMEGGAVINTTQLERGRTSLLTFNNTYIMILGMSFILAIVMAWMLRNNPAMMILSLIILVIFVLVVIPMFSNVFENFITDTPMEDTADDFNIMVALIRNLPFICGILGGILILVMFGKSRAGGEYY